MNYKKYTTILLAMMSVLTLSSCFSDDTTIGDRPLSEIIIDGNSIQTVYDINKNDVLSITPKCRQTNKEKPLTYTWEIGEEVYSHEPTFSYVGNKLGSWQCRLIIENEDGKSFFPFKLNVNSPYEEGITILSEDENGKPMISFMSVYNGEDKEFYNYDCFAINNPDETIASHPADIVQSGGSLIVACQGSDKADDVPTLYYLNEKTMVAENILTVKEYSDFKPTILAIPSMDASGVAYPVLCENGKVYEFSTTEGAIVKPTKLQYTYAQNILVRDNGTGYNYELLLWDNEIGGLLQIYNGYGPYYCSKTYHLTRDKCTGTDNYFDGRSLCKLMLVRMTYEQAMTNDPQMLVLAKTTTNLIQKVVLNTSFWKYNFDTAETSLADNGGVKMANINTCPVTEKTPAIANMTYYSMLYADGNKVMRWNYTTSQLMNKADVLQTIGSDNAVITGFELSADHKKTYVAFYEPSQQGKNGSLWVIDTDKGTVLAKHDNIAYKPVKMIYKKK